MATKSQLKKAYGDCMGPLGVPMKSSAAQELETLMRKQIIVTGIEAQLCVYQTVSDLLNKSYEIQVVADAVSSRTEVNKDIGLDRIKSLGGGITSTEMIICELLKDCEHPQFREVIGLIK